MKMPLDQMGATGLDTAQMDPTKQLEQLEGVAEDVKELPAQDIRGVQAKGYSGTIDATKAIEQLPPSSRRRRPRRPPPSSGRSPSPCTSTTRTARSA